MSDCVFCKIAAGELPSHKVYEDDLVMAFLDIQGWTKGHTLIIPKGHYVNMLETPDELIAKITVLAKDLANNYKTTLHAKGFYFMAAGVDVPHFHYHVIPYYEDANVEFRPTNQPKDQNFDQVAADLRND
jgi:histidine triad (HIT) family protein